VITGWFSEFALFPSAPAGGQVPYGAGPDCFAGATYDPTSHYRAAAVFEFFERQDLTPTLLREVSQHQVRLLARLFGELDLDPAVMGRDRSVPIDRIGGFLALQCPRAEALSHRLRHDGVATDSRGDLLRLGPAPYLSDEQLRAAVRLLGQAAANASARLRSRCLSIARIANRAPQRSRDLRRGTHPEPLRARVGEDRHLGIARGRGLHHAPSRRGAGQREPLAILEARARRCRVRRVVDD